MTAIDSPGTQPDLTDSASSQSSSYTSTITSNDFSAGSMNFEEINLDDDKTSTRLDLGGKENWMHKHGVTKRPALTMLQTQPAQHNRATDPWIKSAVATTTRRNFTTPASSVPARSLTSRTRSESPVLYKTRSASKVGQFAQTPATTLAIPNRRGSWQPQRKTIYELEAEYHESDDELPDDASLFNVPVSPLVRTQCSIPGSATSSARGSPDRGPTSLSPAPLPLSVSEGSSRRMRSGKQYSRQRLSHRASTSQLRQNKSTSTSPEQDPRYTRTKSWNVLVADLDPEARLIAEKLDFFIEQSDARSTKVSSHRSSAPGAIPLPPIQRGTLDFMPMSKEKEAVLSRTRPSWLPPKDPREEKKHLEEYKQMMKASRDAEQRREAKLKNQQGAGESTRDALRRIWAFYVEPTTDLTVIDKRIYDLCWQGLPSSLRGRVWQRRLGSSSSVPDDPQLRHIFAGCKAKVQHIKSTPVHELTEHDKTMVSWFDEIDRDAETAFTDRHLFQRHGPRRSDLVDLCECYAVHHPQAGYAYGLQLMAALILLHVPDPADAFALLLRCLSQDTLHAFQGQDQTAIMRTFDKIQSTLDIKFPRLHAYLFDSEEAGGLGFVGTELFDPMCRTMFANGLSPDTLSRVWDIWIFEGDRYLIRTAVALLGSLQTQIFEIQGDLDLRRRNIQEMLGWGPRNRDASGYWILECDAFIDEIRAAGKLDCAAV